MDRYTNRDEQDIQTLVNEGNDEQLVRLIFLLLDIPTSQAQERCEALLQLGTRYVTLARATSETDLVSGYGERAIAWCQEAISYLTTALQIQESSQAYRARGFAHSIVKDYEHARLDLTLALELSASEEEQADIYYLRGLIYGLCKDYEQGTQDLKKAVALMPDRHDHRQALTWIEEQAGLGGL